MPLFTENIPERDGRAFELHVGHPEHRQSLADLSGHRPRLADARKITLDVCHENRNSARAEAFGEALKRYRFASARRAGYDTVTIRHLRQQEKFRCVFFCN